MREKLKAVLHRRKKSTPTHSPRTSYEKSEGSSPRAERHHASLPQHHPSSEAHNRVLPTHSAYDGERSSHSPASQFTSSQDDQSRNTDLTGSIADDYRSYLPAIAPIDNSPSQQQTSMAGDRHALNGAGDGRYAEEIADKNVHQRKSSLQAHHSKPLPVIPNSSNVEHDHSHKQPIATGPISSTIHPIPSRTTAGKHAIVGDRIAENGQLKSLDGKETRTASSGKITHHQDMFVKPRHDHETAKDYDSIHRGQDWKAKQQSMLEGVVDLNNTVDTDRDTTWAPAVTHEVIKPHEHEVIQHRLYREIHNYTYYHRLQPVLHTEVLPPRHFIPNPDGEGLIEISADELPARTGKNRWWDIVQKEPVLPQGAFEWRTEPEIIEGKPYMTAEGFERRETTIIYPPTLEDMSNYRGMVQPVHFDHKTGKRWLGELTTVEKLKQESERTESKDSMDMTEVTAGLPEILPSPTIKRKPVGLGSM
ncbi:hypothetical protein PtrSN002B_002915 [Pyrenophora tritici-repentis]|uniref:Uncharacterized protein n=1 Tax=Pyrenophora tritici-repentis TaxID=45151 RepID=A0A2W1DXH0_9PLEO|nr:hypothetical protein PtrV1_01083 [Pyrenophora tritici-repentis]KAF7453802.1 hypothetical protein A1F99_010600 [Pyrenophora tritici-repentis]KAF7576895.1 hypothetical protein PtrM4_011350 [Pyrenophora tritici-repentis]KAG9387563.1 hypothetical protein A1F94_000455 [Pyrenophora tritici-repentis]KAI0584627.1 hypothetical protein Alg215_02985 [Pyrenophora tritici-repentis]